MLPSLGRRSPDAPVAPELAENVPAEYDPEVAGPAESVPEDRGAPALSSECE